jgi:hypothetical protein
MIDVWYTYYVGSISAVLFIFTVTASIYIRNYSDAWEPYATHGVVMMVSFVCMAGNAVLMKKVGGELSKYHGQTMTAVIVVALIGLAVVYSDKTKHFTSTHAQCGVACLLGCLIQAPIAYLVLTWFPQYSSEFRITHKYAGRILIIFAWIVCIIGWSTLASELSTQLAFGVPLLILAPMLFLD